MENSTIQKLQNLAAKYVDRHTFINMTPLVTRFLELMPDMVENIENARYTEDEAEEYGCEAGEWKEICSWIWVDEFTYEKLKNMNEPVLDLEGQTFWGRTCYGQAYCLDSCIQDIAQSAYQLTETIIRTGVATYGDGYTHCHV